MVNTTRAAAADNMIQMAYIGHLENKDERHEAFIKKLEQDFQPLADILKGVEKHYAEKLTPGIEEKVKQEIFEKEVEQRRARTENLKVATIDGRSFFECPICKSENLALTRSHGFAESLCCKTCGLTLQAGLGDFANPPIDTLQKLWNSFAWAD